MRFDDFSFPSVALTFMGVYNKWISGFVPSALRPNLQSEAINFRYSAKPLYDIALLRRIRKFKNIEIIVLGM